MTARDHDRCPGCWLAIDDHDPNSIRRGGSWWHGPCWAQVYASVRPERGTA